MFTECWVRVLKYSQALYCCAYVGWTKVGRMLTFNLTFESYDLYTPTYTDVGPLPSVTWRATRYHLATLRIKTSYIIVP